MIDTIIGSAAKILDKIIPDPAARDAAKLALIQLEQSGELAALKAETDLALAQSQVNAAEAASGNLFVGGWRPFIGWVCGLALLYTYLLRPVMNPWVTQWTAVPMEALDMFELMSILFGMLGLGGYRTFEKVKGVTK